MARVRRLISFRETAPKLTSYESDCRCSDATTIEYSFAGQEGCRITTLMRYHNERCSSYIEAMRTCIAAARVDADMEHTFDGDEVTWTSRSDSDLSKLTGVHQYCFPSVPRPYCAVTAEVGFNSPNVLVGLEAAQALAQALHDVGVACGAKPILHPRSNAR